MSATIIARAFCPYDKFGRVFKQVGNTYKETFNSDNVKEAESFGVSMYNSLGVTKASTDGGLHCSYRHRMTASPNEPSLFKPFVDNEESEEEECDVEDDVEDAVDAEGAASGLDRDTISPGTVISAITSFVKSKV